jgi:uncharacterized protein with HEPN domain
MLEIPSDIEDKTALESVDSFLDYLEKYSKDSQSRIEELLSYTFSLEYNPFKNNNKYKCTVRESVSILREAYKGRMMYEVRTTVSYN